MKRIKLKSDSAKQGQRIELIKLSLKMKYKIEHWPNSNYEMTIWLKLILNTKSKWPNLHVGDLRNAVGFLKTNNTCMKRSFEIRENSKQNTQKITNLVRPE